MAPFQCFPTWLAEDFHELQNYPLTLEHVSVHLQKGRGCIYLDNKEHTILEHCVSPDESKLIADSLHIMLLVDVDHFKEEKAHWEQYEFLY